MQTSRHQTFYNDAPDHQRDNQAVYCQKLRELLIAMTRMNPSQVATLLGCAWFGVESGSGLCTATGLEIGITGGCSGRSARKYRTAFSGRWELELADGRKKRMPPFLAPVGAHANEGHVRVELALLTRLGRALHAMRSLAAHP